MNNNEVHMHLFNREQSKQVEIKYKDNWYQVIYCPYRTLIAQCFRTFDEAYNFANEWLNK